MYTKYSILSFLCMLLLCNSTTPEDVTRFDFLLVRFEPYSDRMTEQSRNALEDAIEVTLVSGKLDNYRILIKSIDCPEELEKDSLIGLLRKNAVLQMCKNRTGWKHAPIYIDNWNIEIDSNRTVPCSTTGVYLFAEEIFDPIEYEMERYQDSMK